LKKGDIVLTTDKEHNSNLVPWQIQKKLRKICHKIVISNKDNTFDLEKFENMMSKKVKLVSMVHTSNLDGYILPVDQIIKIAHEYGALVMLDGAQSASRMSIDVQKLDVDFFAFSFHKMLGPAGGALYGKYHLLEELSPFIVGGNTVELSTYESSIFLKIPEKFEAGLQDYAGAIGAGVAADYIINAGIKNIEKHEYDLNRFITDKISNIPEISIIGPVNPKLRSGIVTFNIKNTEPHDVAMLLDNENIMVRSGVFCVHSWFKAHNINGAVRASFYLYNTKEECDVFVENIKEIIKRNKSL
jgi:cysteine desulfurase/selenocysteine lyase